LATPVSVTLAAKYITRDELARRAECSPAWMTEIVAGRRRPSDALARRIADVLDIPVDDLFADDTAAVVVSFVRRTTAASGVPERLEDVEVADHVASAFKAAR
jgi:transcriptional regulator with XRE-family HTH domain